MEAHSNTLLYAGVTTSSKLNSLLEFSAVILLTTDVFSESDRGLGEQFSKG